MAEGEWARSSNRLLVALGAEALDVREARPSIRLTLPYAVYTREAAKRQALVRQREQASQAAAEARTRRAAGIATEPVPGRYRAGTEPVKRDSSDASGVSSRPRTREALERSKSAMNQERSGAHQPATSIESSDALDRSAIAGAIYDGLEAAAEAKVRQWRVAQARELLERACVGWAARGMLKDANGRDRLHYQADVIRIASAPTVTPAAMEIAINRCNLRAANADEGPLLNALAYVIRALGACRGGRPLEPYLTDQPIVDRWAQLERRLFDAERTRAAAMGAATRIDDARKRLSPPTNPHPHPGNVAGAGGAGA